MIDNAARSELSSILKELASLLEGDPTVSGWRAFLSDRADYLDDADIATRSALAQVKRDIETWYSTSTRFHTDYVIPRDTLEELRAVNNRFRSLEANLFSLLKA